MDELEQQRQELKASIADREIAKGFHLTKDHLAFFLYDLRNLNFEDRESQKRLISIFVNSVFVFEDGTIKITFNYSGENNTVTLTDLTAAEGGEVFGRCASCSTIKTAAHLGGVFMVEPRDGIERAAPAILPV